MSTQIVATAAGAKTFTAKEKNACSLDAMLNGGTCEVCQWSPILLLSRFSSHLLNRSSISFID